MSPVEIPHDLLGQSSLYNHSDPLLRRLRLDDSSGGSITDLDKAFKGKEVVVLYAGSEHGSNNLKSFHRDLTRFGMIENKTCTIVYVSTDTNPEEPKRVLASQPWLRMTFFDDSDFAPIIPMRDGSQVTEMEEISRGEEFIQAGELEMGVEKITWGEEEYQHDYVRPLSRAAVTVLMRSFATPSVSIYHIPTHQFLSRNVKLSAFQTGTIEANYRKWKNGGTPSLRIYDIAYAMRYSIVAIILALLYQLLVKFGGDEYNVIPKWLDQLSWRSRQLLSQ